MKPHARELRAAADDMMGQLRPSKVLRDATDLALKLGRDDAFREYVAVRAWAVIGVVLVFFLVSTICSIDFMFRVASGSPIWLKGLALIVGAVVWSGGLLAQVYVFLIWLEERAAQRHREEQGVRLEVPRGILPYLKYSRALPPWIVILACVVLPLAVMARRLPVEALLLAAASILAPVVFRKLAP